jgi:hypothetical protein
VRRYAVLKPRASIATASAAAAWSERTSMPIVRAQTSAINAAGERRLAPMPRTRRARAISAQMSPKVWIRCSAAEIATTLPAPPQISPGPIRAPVMPGRFDQQPAGMSVAGLGDPALGAGRPRGVLGGHQPQV